MATDTQSDSLAQQTAFNQVRPQAAAVPDTSVKKRGDVQLALHNVNKGLDAILGRRAELETRWQPTRMEALAQARPLALAAVFASTRVTQLDVNEKDLLALISQMYDTRDKFFTVLDMAARWELLPAERVEKIRAGSGPIDGGQDLISAVALCREFAPALENKTPLIPAFLADAEATGNRVVEALKSDGARKSANVAAKEAADLANRIWTLLLAAHAELRKAGFELWGEALDAHVPLLQSRVGGGRRRPVKADAPGA